MPLAPVAGRRSDGPAAVALVLAVLAELVPSRYTGDYVNTSRYSGEHTKGAVLEELVLLVRIDLPAPVQVRNDTCQ